MIKYNMDVASWTDEDEEAYLTDPVEYIKKAGGSSVKRHLRDPEEGYNLNVFQNEVLFGTGDENNFDRPLTEHEREILKSMKAAHEEEERTGQKFEWVYYDFD